MDKRDGRTRVFTILLAVLLLLSLSGCAQEAGEESAGLTSPASEQSPEPEGDGISRGAEAEAPSERAEGLLDDFDQNTSQEGAETINLSGTEIQYSGSSAAVAGSVIEITSGGTFLLTGTLTDGQIRVDTKEEVHLILENAQITSGSSAAIYIKDSGRTVLTLRGENSLTDAQDYTEVEEDEPSACLFSKDDLTINGDGALTITANYNDGIACKDDLKLLGGTVRISSVDDGIIGRDLLAVTGGTYELDVQGDGMKSTNDQESALGSVLVLGGTLDFTCGNDGIQSASSLEVSGGEIHLVTGGGSAAAPENQSGAMGFLGGSGQTQEEASAKGLKAETDLTVSGGTIGIDAADDAIHCNGTVLIGGGQLTLSTGDDGVHADSRLQITDCKLEITRSYEGLESAELLLDGGEISIVSSDDGINAAGGADGSNAQGAWGGDPFSTSTGSLAINGGTITVDASGDGLDANGDILMTGGTVTVHGPESGANGALDYDGCFILNGGTLIAAGSTQMAQAPTEDSTQYSIFAGAEAAAGTEILLKDSTGATVLSYVPQKQVGCVVFSCPEIREGETYTVVVGGQSAGEATVTSAVTTVGGVSPGVGGSGMGGGGGMKGGMGGFTPGEGGMAPPDWEGMEPGEMPELREGETPDFPEGMPPGQEADRSQQNQA